jgi:ATP-binding cassette subfamily C protein/ATP-binding cassette subfamily C protein LapB
MSARADMAAVAAAIGAGGQNPGAPGEGAAAALPWLAAPREQGAHQGDVPAANCLKPLLAALGWSGEARYLQEAIGVEHALATLPDLRRVLFRLNYLTTSVQAELGDIPLSDFPFLLARTDGDIWVVLSREGDRLTVFKGGSNLVASIDLKQAVALGGSVYVIAPDTTRSKTSKSFTSWTLNTIASEGKTIRWLFFLTFAVNLAALAVPIYLIAVYDRAIAAKSLLSLFYLLGGVLLAVALEMTLREMRARSLAFLGARMEGLMMAAAFERLLLLPAQLIENASVGAQLARLKLFESMRDVFSGPLAAALLDLPFVLIFVFAVFVIGGELGWLIVAFIALLLLLIGLAVPMARRHTSKAGDVRSESQKFLMEFTDNIEVIRRCGAEEVWIDRYRELTEENLSHAAAAQRASVVEQTLSQSLVLITGSALIGVGAWLVIEGSFTSGALFAMMSLVWRVLSPIQTAFLHLNKLTHASAIVRQIDQLMRIEPEYHPEQVPTVPRSFKGPIELQGVVMRYTPRGEPAIRGVSLQIPRNAFVALTGHVGAGKSTILKIIAQLYLPQAGTVLIDGLDYRQFDAHLLRHAMGFLPQKQDVFTGTIAENIRFSFPAATDEAITAMLKRLGGEEVLAGVEGGIDAPIDLRHPVIGTKNFIQKIMLARAFIGQPAILLLDEPGLRLDALADDALRMMLAEIKGKATIVLTTTRPSYMYLADRLVVLKAGQVMGQDAPNRVIAALLAEKFKKPGAGKPTAPLRDLRDILPTGAKEAEQ